MYGMKRLLSWLEICTLFIQQKTTEKVGLYASNTFKSTVLKFCIIINLEKEIDMFFDENTKVINGIFISYITD